MSELAPAYVIGRCIGCDGELTAMRDAPSSIAVRCQHCGKEQRLWQAVVRATNPRPLAR